MVTVPELRLAFVDDHPTLLRGLSTIFAADGRYSIAATGSSAEDAVQIALAHRPDVVILDLSMPGDVFAAIDRITGSSPTLKIVIFTAFANVDLALKAIDAGAHGFVLKGAPAEDLHDAIKTVMLGELYVSPEFSQRLVAGLRNRSKQVLPAAKLSARERQIVVLLLEAKTNKEIAKALELTEKTVKHYMTNLMNKLDVKSRLQVALAAQKLLASPGTEPGDVTG